MAETHIEIVGLIWRRTTDGIQFSAHIGASPDIVYLDIPKLEAHLQQQAAQRGISVGDICDEVNAAISEAERERMKSSRLPYIEVEFELTPEQAQAFAKLFEGSE